MHLAPFPCGPLSFVGFNAARRTWGRNPIAERLYRHVDDRHADVVKARKDADAIFKAAKKDVDADFAARLAELGGGRKRLPARPNIEALKQEREAKVRAVREPVEKVDQSPAYRAYVNERWTVKAKALAETIRDSAVPAGRTIVVTHERLSDTGSEFRGVPLFLFGHQHVFADRTFKGARFVNMAALDICVFVQPKDAAPSDLSRAATPTPATTPSWNGAGRRASPSPV